MPWNPMNVVKLYIQLYLSAALFHGLLAVHEARPAHNSHSTWHKSGCRAGNSLLPTGRSRHIRTYSTSLQVVTITVMLVLTIYLDICAVCAAALHCGLAVHCRSAGFVLCFSLHGCCLIMQRSWQLVDVWYPAQLDCAPITPGTGHGWVTAAALSCC